MLGSLPGPLVSSFASSAFLHSFRPDLPRSPFVKPSALTLPSGCAVSSPYYHRPSKKLHPPKQQRNRVIECFSFSINTEKSEHFLRLTNVYVILKLQFKKCVLFIFIRHLEENTKVTLINSHKFGDKGKALKHRFRIAVG